MLVVYILLSDSLVLLVMWFSPSVYTKIPAYLHWGSICEPMMQVTSFSKIVDVYSNCQPAHHILAENLQTEMLGIEFQVGFMARLSLAK